MTDDGKQQTAALSPYPGGRMRTRDLVAISALWFGINYHWGSLLLVIVPSQIKRMTDDPALYQGILVGVGALFALSVPLLAGALSDRCTAKLGRRRPFLLAGTALNVAGLAVFWAAGRQQTFAAYLAASIVVQIGNNIASGAYNGLIPDLAPPGQRGEASGWMAAMTQFGTILGAFFSGMLMSEGHALASYALIAVALVISLAVTAAGSPEQPLAVQPGPWNWRGFFASLWVDPRRYPDFAWVWVTRFFVTMGMWSVQPFLQYYVADVAGVADAERTVAILFPIILVTATITGVTGGRLSDRVGRKRIVYFANGVIAAVSVGFLFARSLNTVYLLGLLYGIGYGAYYSVDWALAIDVLPDRLNAGKHMAVWHIALTLPQSLAAPVGGMVLGAFGHTRAPGPEGVMVTSYPLEGYTALLCMAAFFLILGALLLRNVRGVR